MGGQLLRPLLARLDAERESCYLETLAERTLPLYERHGFEAVADVVEPASGLRLWCCFRQPQ